MPEVSIVAAGGVAGARRFNAPIGHRFAQTSGTYDAAARTVELIIATDAMVRMPGYVLGLDCDYYYEILDCGPAAVDLTDVRAGNCPVLDAHSRFSINDQLGKVTDARSEGGNQIIALCALGQSAAARNLEAEIAAGTAPKTSAGYRRDQVIFEKFEGEVPVYRVTRWALREASFVPIAADPNAGVRSEQGDAFPCTIEKETRAMPDQNGNAAGAAIEPNALAAAEAAAAASAAGAAQSFVDGERSAADQAPARGVAAFTGAAALAFVDQARAFGDDVATRAEELVAQNGRGEITIDGANVALLRASADAQRSATSSVVGGGRAIEVTADARDKWRRGAENSIIQRAGLAPLLMQAAKIRGETIDLDPGELRGVRNVDLARMALEHVGERASSFDPDEIVGRALAYRAGPFQTTSDFPVLLEAVVHKSLQAAFTVAPDTWRRFAGTTSVQDFRPHNRYLTGSFGKLDDVLEDGEIKNKPIPDGAKETIKATSKGNIVGLSRQAIVNDDMNVFSQISTQLGRAAKLSIEIDVYALLALNGGLGPLMADGLTLFHANHGNIATVAGGPSVPTFEAMDVQMSQQKDISGNDYIEIAPSVWVGPRGLRGDAMVVNDSQYDNNVTQKFQIPNRVRGLFKDIVGSPRVAGTRWYGFADPDVAAAIEVAFLNGVQEPRLEQRDGWRVDGTEWRVLFDYGVGAVNWRAAATNAGA